MKVFLEVVSGPGLGERVVIEDGTPVSVGRGPSCTVNIPKDRFISGRHFEVVLAGDLLFLRDLNSTNGTFVNGVRVSELSLSHTDSIQAGESAFSFQSEAVQPPSVLEALAAQPEPLYAVLDAARDPKIFPFLLSSGAPHWCLYTGDSAQKLETVAPYLVYLHPESTVLAELISKSWGKSWGVFLTSSQPPETIWHELRRSLMVILESTQKWVYFRYYDPRVLRIFLPIVDEQQREQFARKASSFIMEGETPNLLLRFRLHQTGVNLDQMLITPPEELSL